MYRFEDFPSYPHSMILRVKKGKRNVLTFWRRIFFFQILAHLYLKCE